MLAIAIIKRRVKFRISLSGVAGLGFRDYPFGGGESCRVEAELGGVIRRRQPGPAGSSLRFEVREEESRDLILPNVGIERSRTGHYD